MTLLEWIGLASTKLNDEGITSARLDCLILLEDLLSKERSWLLAHPETDLSKPQLKILNKQISRRLAHEPLAYIRGFSEFYGRKFRVNKRVLEPRPESEAMIEQLKKIGLNDPIIADVGTGSGCLGITAALEVAGAKVDLYDIDSNALAVAKHNAHLHEVSLQGYKRDLLNRPIQRYDVILANLPYLPDSWNIDRSISAEPRLAFVGGKDGLRLYARLFEQLDKLGWTKLWLITEALPPQHKSLKAMAESHGFKQTARQDFVQVFYR